MLIIAEKINIMSKTIGPAMKAREKGPVQELARLQVKGGARCLDLNLGPATKDGPGMMQWLVQTVEEVVDDSIQLSLDTKNLEAMEAGLAVVKKHKPMINSTNADEGVLDKMMPLAAKYDADIIALAMTLAGIPRDRDERMVNAATIIGKAMEHGVSLDRIYLDPLVLPIGVAEVHGEFSRGDVIAVRTLGGAELARGLANYSSAETRLIARRPSAQIEAALGYVNEPELIHRTTLVLL